MRLTLRYLLAYMDDQLEPADAQAMAQMIEASPFATELMHRLRDVSRRLKLGAPAIDSRGLTGDANTVAEYLDHTMTPEQVSEFEKICLASEVHLAEVASAHQILALVLGERAEVDPQMRRRMYMLPHREEVTTDEPELAPSREADEGPAGQAPVAGSRRRRPEIPEWLREQPKHKSPWLRVGVAAVLLIGAAIGGYLYVFLPSSGLGLAQVGAPGEAPAPVDGAQSGDDIPARTAGEAADVPAADTVAGAEEPGADGTANDIPFSPVAPDEGADIATERDTAAAALPTDALPTEAQPTETVTNDLPPQRPLREPPAALSTADPDDAFNDVVPGAAPTGHVLDDQGLVPGRAANAQRGGAADPAANAVGRLSNDSEVLLHVGVDGSWIRLSTSDPLLPGEMLLALPTFRPGIALRTGEGATAYLLGGSLIQLIGPNENGVPGLNVIDGQVVVSTAGKPGTQLALQIAGETYLVTFVTADATMAVDVRRMLPDGADPLSAPPVTTADLYVTSGEIEYSSASSVGPQTAKFPTFRRLGLLEAGGPAATSSTENTFPAWINGNPLSQIEKMAAETLDKELTRGKPVDQRLRELSENRRVEVRNLAVNSLTLLGDFQGVLPVLNDTTAYQRTNWPNQIEAVRRVLARDPDMAQRLMATLEGQRDAKKAKDLYEMLMGFSRQQLQDGAAARLVADLDNDNLDFRVLAFWNLQRVVVGTLNYRPEMDTPEKRQASVRAWRQRLAKGQIVPKGS